MLQRRSFLASLLAFGLFAAPASAADFELKDVALDFGTVVLRAPTLAVTGSPLEADAFRALIAGKGAEPVADRLAKLDAASIVAPEFVVEQRIGPQRQLTTYRDLRLNGVSGGRIARAESSGASLSVTGGEQPMSGTFGRTLMEDTDLAQLARVITEAAPAGQAETPRTIFGRVEQQGYALDFGPQGRVTIGRYVGTGFGARRAAEPLGTLVTRIAALADETTKEARKQGPDGPVATDADRRMGLAMLRAVEAIDIGSGEMVDFAMTLTPPAPKGEKPDTVEMRFGRIAYGTMALDGNGVSAERFAFSADGARGEVASISQTGFSAGPVIAELIAMLEKPMSDPDAFDFRRLVPVLGTVRMAGMSVDVPARAAARGKPASPAAKIGVGRVELTARDQINGIPTALSLAIDNLVVPVVESPANPGLRDLIAMGYRSLDLSTKLDVAWTAATNELAIRQLSFSGANLFSLQGSAVLGNVTRELFSPDLALAQVAALGATARSLDITLENRGLAERLLENEARKSRRKPDDLRREYSMIASIGLAGILGPSEAAKTLAAAVSRFVAKPGTLVLQARAKTPAGLGLADVLTVADPTEILGMIDLKADAR